MRFQPQNNGIIRFQGITALIQGTGTIRYLILITIVVDQADINLFHTKGRLDDVNHNIQNFIDLQTLGYGRTEFLQDFRTSQFITDEQFVDQMLHQCIDHDGCHHEDNRNHENIILHLCREHFINKSAQRENDITEDRKRTDAGDHIAAALGSQQRQAEHTSCIQCIYQTEYIDDPGHNIHRNPHKRRQENQYVPCIHDQQPQFNGHHLSFQHFILLAMFPQQEEHMYTGTKGDTIKEDHLPCRFIQESNRTIRCQHRFRRCQQTACNNIKGIGCNCQYQPDAPPDTDFDIGKIHRKQQGCIGA